MKSLMLLLGFMLFGTAAFAQSDSAQRVVLETNHGTIVIELDREHAPSTVESFLEGVASEIYNGSIFHRVLPDFMIQGGGFMPEMEKIPTEKSLVNEADNGLKNLRGTVAMARMPAPHSASIQFFINLVDNDFLDHTAKTAQGWGYAVFGRVVEGMEVADQISAVPRGQVGPFGDVPDEPVVIESATLALQPATASEE